MEPHRPKGQASLFDLGCTKRKRTEDDGPGYGSVFPKLSPFRYNLIYFDLSNSSVVHWVTVQVLGAGGVLGGPACPGVNIGGKTTNLGLRPMTGASPKSCTLLESRTLK
jgi:hypothetical protein